MANTGSSVPASSGIVSIRFCVYVAPPQPHDQLPLLLGSLQGTVPHLPPLALSIFSFAVLFS
jgi:hypothetical protein